MQRIKSEYKKMDITVNSYIFAQLMREQPTSKIIIFPFSTRESNRSINNQITTIKFHHKYDDALSFGENAKNVHKAR